VELETDVIGQVAPAAGSHKPEYNDENVVALQAAILDKLTYSVGKRRAIATEHDWLMATSLALRDQIVDGWLAGIDAAYQNGSKRVYYLSLEFLIGRLLFDNLNNLNKLDTMRAALAGLEVDLDKLRALEPDAALGNGGLGRLAACFMESMATLDIPAHGYGIRYEHGLFRQVNSPRTGSPWATRGNSTGRRSITRSASAARSRRWRSPKRRSGMSGTRRKRSRPWHTTRRPSAGAAGG
jgi:hypothetical protein